MGDNGNGQFYLEPGDALVAEWGYDQTNATFFRVESRTAKMATVVQVEAETWYDEDGNPTTRLAPSERIVFGHDWRACEEPAGLNGLESREYHAAYGLPCRKAKRYKRKIHNDGGGERDRPYVKIESWGIYARLYMGGGAYDTIAAGLPGH